MFLNQHCQLYSEYYVLILSSSLPGPHSFVRHERDKHCLESCVTGIATKKIRSLEVYTSTIPLICDNQITIWIWISSYISI